MKKRILSVLLFATITIVAQESFLEFQIETGYSSVQAELHNVFTVLNEENRTFALFTDDGHDVQASLINFEGEEKKSFSSKRLPKKYDEIIGYTIDNGEINLFLKNTTNKKFGSVNYDFDSKWSQEKLYDFKLKNEVYFDGISHNNLFYLVTLTKKSSKLNFYAYEGQDLIEKKTIELVHQEFKDKNGNPINLYKQLLGKTKGTVVGVGLTPTLKVAEIDPNSPITIESSSALGKIYQKEDGFNLSIENETSTFIFDFFLPELTYTTTIFEKPIISSESANSNSFIYKENIYFITASSDEMRFSSRNMNTKELIFEEHLLKDEEIPFKNTPIIQEGGHLDKYRELKKSTRLLRRLGKENIGISVQTVNNNYVITIGSTLATFSNTNSLLGAGAIGPGFGLSTASTGTLFDSYNPTWLAFQYYRSSKATHIKCLYDKNFKHLDGDVPENIFDIINTSANRIKSKRGETLFKLEDSYIWGYFNATTKRFNLYTF